MKTIKDCRNCDKSFYIGTPDDPDRHHSCDVITSGRIKNEIECKEYGYKYFSQDEELEISDSRAKMFWAAPKSTVRSKSKSNKGAVI